MVLLGTRVPGTKRTRPAGKGRPARGIVLLADDGLQRRAARNAQVALPASNNSEKEMRRSYTVTIGGPASRAAGSRIASSRRRSLSDHPPLAAASARVATAAPSARA
jgi:hypothetical protein